MKIIGQMAISDFSMIEMTLTSLCYNCDEVYIRVDGNKVPSAKIPQIKSYNNKIKDVLISKTPWNKYTWREEMIRMLDAVTPDIVLSLDEDETLSTSLTTELSDFLQSNKKFGMFSYHKPLPTLDGAVLFNGRSYPLAQHCKIFRWEPGLKFIPYIGYCIPTNFKGLQGYMFRKIEIMHYCFYNPSERIDKILKTQQFYPKYFSRYGVTIDNIENYFQNLSIPK